MKYTVVEHVDPMANSYVPMMTIVVQGGGRFEYQAVPVPDDRAKLKDQTWLQNWFIAYKLKKKVTTG